MKKAALNSAAFLFNIPRVALAVDRAIAAGQRRLAHRLAKGGVGVTGEGDILG